MARIGSYNNHLTILVAENLWLMSESDDVTTLKMKAEDVAPHIRESFAGARPVLDALFRRDVAAAKDMITAYEDVAYVGKLKVMKSNFSDHLENLWGYPPGNMSRSVM